MTIQLQTISVPTSQGAPQRREVDLRHWTESDLRSLEKADAFLFHSIKTLHEAKLTGKNVDFSAVASDAAAAGLAVARKTRVSTECHAACLLEDDDLLAELERLAGDAETASN